MTHGTSHSPQSQSSGHDETLPQIDVRERGAPKAGEPQFLERRLFMQLLVFQIPSRPDTAAAIKELCGALRERGAASVVYEDVNDPRGIGVLSWSEDPAQFVSTVRPVLAAPELGLVLRPEFSMLGRTYSTGFESDLGFWLLDRPKQTVLEEKHPWAVWYPLRRVGAFARLEGREQGAILREHGLIGRAYGAQDLAHDVRLACHGLDANDNEFVIGLVGKDLYPLSHVVQAMRKTRQTAEYMQQMGPFFVGHAIFRNAGK
jgi:chlorite dismutase